MSWQFVSSSIASRKPFDQRRCGNPRAFTFCRKDASVFPVEIIKTRLEIRQGKIVEPYSNMKSDSLREFIHELLEGAFQAQGAYEIRTREMFTKIGRSGFSGTYMDCLGLDALLGRLKKAQKLCKVSEEASYAYYLTYPKSSMCSLGIDTIYYLHIEVQIYRVRRF